MNSHLPRSLLLAALAAATIFTTASAPADETCFSPYIAKIVGQEDFMYIWTLGVEGVGDEQDKLVDRRRQPQF